MATVILVILGILSPFIVTGWLLQRRRDKKREKEARKPKESGKSLKLCPDCGVVNKEDAKYCGKCGSKLSEEIEKCSNSGAELEPLGERVKKDENFRKGSGSFLLGLFLWIVFSCAGASSPYPYSVHVVTMLSIILMVFGPILFWIVFPLKERWYDKGKRKGFYAVMVPIGLIFLIFLEVTFLPP